MKNTLQILLAAIAVIISTNANSQEYVKQIIAAEGAGVEAYVSSYNPQTGLTTVFDTIAVPYVQCVIVDSNFAYVAANDSLVMYNIDTYERVNIIALSNPHLMKVYQNKLIVGRWTSASDNIWLKIYDKSNLSLIANIPEIDDQTYGIAISNDSAYVSVYGGYNSFTGKIAVIDLQNNSFERFIDYGTNGQGIGDLMTDDYNIYMVNQTLSYATPSDTIGGIGVYEINAGTTFLDTFQYNFGSGYFVNGTAMFLNINENIAVYDLYAQNFADITRIAKPSTMSFTSVQFDNVNNIIYAAATDYWSASAGYTYDLSGNAIDTFDLGISVESIAIDYRTTVNINENISENSISIYPNPANDFVTVTSLKFQVSSCFIVDVYGKTIKQFEVLNSEFRINLEDLPSGIYFLRLSTENGIITKKLVK